jgi:hypothetical protein
MSSSGVKEKSKNIRNKEDKQKVVVERERKRKISRIRNTKKNCLSKSFGCFNGKKQWNIHMAQSFSFLIKRDTCIYLE